MAELDAGQDLDRVGRDVVAADQRGAFGDPAAGALDVGAVSARAGDEVAEAGEHVPVAALQPHEVALVLDDGPAALGEREGAVALLDQLALCEVARAPPASGGPRRRRRPARRRPAPPPARPAGRTRRARRARSRARSPRTVRTQAAARRRRPRRSSDPDPPRSSPDAAPAAPRQLYAGPSGRVKRGDRRWIGAMPKIVARRGPPPARKTCLTSDQQTPASAASGAGSRREQLVLGRVEAARGATDVHELPLTELAPQIERVQLAILTWRLRRRLSASIRHESASPGGDSATLPQIRRTTQ